MITKEEILAELERRLREKSDPIEYGSLPLMAFRVLAQHAAWRKLFDFRQWILEHDNDPSSLSVHGAANDGEAD